MSEKNAPNENADALRAIFEKVGAIEDVGYTPAQRKPEQVPSVGRIVHYVSHGSPDGTHAAGEHRAAIITQTSPKPEPGTAVVLTVFNPSGLYIGQWVPYDATGERPGSWHWPEHVPAK